LVEPENLSWVGLPLSVHGECIGLLVLEGRETGFFTPEQVQTTVTFSSQAAVALENARLFEESLARAEEMDQRSQRLALLNRLSGELGQTLDVNQILVLTAQQLVAALGAAGAAGILIGPGGTPIVEVEVPQREHLPLALLDVPLFERLRETQGLFSTAEVDTEVFLGKLVDLYCKPRSVQSLLFIPLITGQTLFGWMMIDRSESYRFLPAEMELARTVCNQAAAAIQNARLFDETRSLTEFLERRVEERTGELRKEHQNSQTLLRVISELSTSLDMNLVLNRTLGVINESFGAQESLIFMLQGASQRPYRAGDGLASAGGSVNLEKEIMRKVAHGRSTLISGDITRDERFPAPDEEPPAYRSILAVPLMMGEDALGALMMFHRDADFFRAEQTGLAETTARQLGIAINNAELFNLIRDQAENLGNMLREQQIEASRSRAILEAVADGVVVTDDQGRITLYNHSAERILGMKSGETLGQNLDIFSSIFQRSGSLWLGTIHAWMKDATTYQDETFSDRFELDNGSVIAVSLAPVLWRTQFLGTVSIFRDITHEVQIDRLKSEFVANVSHELRTPMTSIKGYVEIMLMGATGELSEQQNHFLSIVKMNTERLSVLVNDLLDVSRMEMGRVVLNMQALNLREVVDDVVLDVKRRSQEENKPLRFVVVGEPDLPAVTGDVERVRQIVSSLIINGYNYTPAGGLVEVSLQMVNDEVQVDVRDTGIGIHPDDQHRIFERFYRGDDPLVLASAGTGLGLAIARGLVGMHNGRIWFASSGVRGEGSTFSFTLPIHKG
jgi:PAS domain S-box-containing protein